MPETWNCCQCHAKYIGDDDISDDIDANDNDRDDDNEMLVLLSHLLTITKYTQK